MFCSKCGAQINDTASFCPKCGAAVRSRTVPGQQPGAVPGQTPAQNQQQWQQPATPYQPAAPARKPFPVKLVAIAAGAVVAVAAVVFVVTTFLGGSGGYSTADAAAEQVSDAINAMYAAQSTDELLDACADIVDCLPSEIIETELARYGYEDEEEFILEEMFGSDSVYEVLEELLEITETMTISVTLVPGDALDYDDIEDIEDDLADLGYRYDVTSAVELTGSMTYSTGDSTQSQTLDSFRPLVLIEIDGSWYLWVEM